MHANSSELLKAAKCSGPTFCQDTLPDLYQKFINVMSKEDAKREVTLSLERVYAFAGLFSLIPAIVLPIIFAKQWGENDKNFLVDTLLSRLSLLNLLGVYVLIFLFGILLHEGIHGFFWALYAKKKFTSIRFGVKWEMLTPYTHCSEPLPIVGYRIGAVMPLLILGVMPLFLGFINGSSFLFYFGLIFSLAAAGDLLVLWELKKYSKDISVQDHPTKIGFIIYENKTER